MQESNPTYYAIIPSNVRYDKELNANAKLLYGEITCLCNKDGYCFAQNKYFADLYKVSKTSISKWISLLERKGYISVLIQYKEGTKEIIGRYITLINKGIEVERTPPIEDKLKDNNTSIYNTTSNNTNSDFFSFLIENEVESDIADDYVKFRKAKKAPLTIRVGESLKKEAYTAGYTLNDAIKICLMRGWVGFDSKWLKTPQNTFNKNTITNGTEQPRTNRNR